MSATKDAIVLAFRKGYRVTQDGRVVNATNRERSLSKKGAGKHLRYYQFSIKLPDGRSFSVPVHRLAAYQKFGEAALEAPCTRHLDGDSLNNSFDNIALGSHRDNAMDRTQKERQAHAEKAASYCIAYDWKSVEKDYFKNGMGFRKLEAKYGMSRGTLSNHFNRIPGWKPNTGCKIDWNAVIKHLKETGSSYKEAAAKFNTTVRSLNRKLGPQT